MAHAMKLLERLGIVAARADREGALIAREQELVAIYENAPGIVFYVAIEPDGEFRFASMSQAGLDAMGLTRQHVVGALVRNVIPEASRDLVLSHYRDAVQSGRTVRWKEMSVYPAGRRIGEVAVTPVCASTGVVTHLVGIVHDITERERLAELVHRRENRLAFLLTLNDALRPLSDPGEIQDVTLRLLGEHLGVNRVAYSLIDDDHFVVTRSYENGVPPLRGRGPIAAFGDALVVVSDMRTDPRFTDAERDTLLAYGIVAFVRVMLKKDGCWSASFGVSSMIPRNWFSDEISLIEQTAERMWAAAERARTEQALRESDERLRLVMNAAGAGSWTRDADGNLDWDEGVRRLYGFSPDEPPNTEAWFARVHEDDRPIVLAQIDRMRELTADSWDVSFRIVRPDGTVAWIQSLGRFERNAADEIERLAGLELDVTARREAAVAQQARRDEEHNREIRLLLETATQGIVSVDADGTIVTANRALEAMFGWEPGELIGQPIEKLIPTHRRNLHVRHRSNYFSTPRSRFMGGGLELKGQRKDGHTFPIEVSLNHLATPTGGHAIAFVTDITERRRDAAALRERTVELEHRSDQLRRLASDLTLAEQRAREQLAKTLHDGLQQLLLIATLKLDQHLKHDEKQGASAEPLIEARDHLNQAIAAARSLSVELFPPVLQRDGLAGALAWLAEWTRDKYGLEVRLSCDPLANAARKDVRTLLFESVRELLLNAVKHAHVDRVAVELARDHNDMLCITVSDEGAGFDPTTFLSQRIQGPARWGLFSIQERLTLLGGRLEIESAPGKGSRFCLVAPKGETSDAARTPREAGPTSRHPSAPAVHTANSGSARRLRVLIADDHAALRKAFRDLLEKRANVQVVGEAADGVEAIAQAHALQPDVLLMDISMPRMDGIEATRLVHAQLPCIEIVGLSMYPRTENPSPIEQAGASRFFTKGETQRLIDHLLFLQTAVASPDAVARSAVRASG